MPNNPPLRNALVRTSCGAFGSSKDFREEQQLPALGREERGLSGNYFSHQVTHFALWLEERHQK